MKKNQNYFADKKDLPPLKSLLSLNHTSNLPRSLLFKDKGELEERKRDCIHKKVVTSP